MPISSLDVLEGFFGAIPTADAARQLSLKEIDELGEEIRRSADAHMTDAEPDESFVYPGGWLASGWHEGIFRPELAAALLYYPRLLVHDPLADFFFLDFYQLPPVRYLRAQGGQLTLAAGVEMWARAGSYDSLRQGELSNVRNALARIISLLREVEPLLRSGVVTMRSQWPVVAQRKQNLLSSVRHDVKSQNMYDAVASAADTVHPLPRWDNVRGLGAEPSTGFVTADERWRWQDEYLHLAKTLAIADAYGARYVAPYESDLAVLRVKANNVVKRSGGDHRITGLLNEVARIALPNPSADDVSTLVDIRQSEESFEDWRRTLRRLQRGAQMGEAEDMQTMIEDEFATAIPRIRQASSRLERLRGGLPGEALTASFSAAAVGDVAALEGANPYLAAGAAVASGVADWIVKAYAAPTLSGSDRVLAHLLQ